jgi:hypothetical protein
VRLLLPYRAGSDYNCLAADFFAVSADVELVASPLQFDAVSDCRYVVIEAQEKRCLQMALSVTLVQTVNLCHLL